MSTTVPITFLVRSKHSPPKAISLARECRPGTHDMFNEAKRLARDGVLEETPYGWEYLPADRIDSIEIHLEEE